MQGNWFEKIDEYLNGEMSREDQLQFDEEMKKNRELSSAFHLYKTIEAEMRENEKYKESEIVLRKTLEGLNKRYFKNEKSEELSEDRRNEDILKLKETGVFEQPGVVLPAFKIRVKNLKTKLAFAAALIGIVALAGLWNLKNRNNSSALIVKETSNSLKKSATYDSSFVNNSSHNDATEQNNSNKNTKKGTTAEVISDSLFAAYFTADPAPAITEGPLENAFIYYKNGKYRKTIAAIDQADFNIVTRGDETDQLLSRFYASYYKGICYMMIKNIEKAIPELKVAIAESPGSLLKTKGLWYLSLAYIRTNQPKKAEKLLYKIIKSNKRSVYKAKAEKLARNLNM